MEARAEEAVAALKLMQLRYPEVQVGFLGFSQAGWVIPIAASQSQPAFFCDYWWCCQLARTRTILSKLRYEQQGKTPDEIIQLLAKEQKKMMIFLDYMVQKRSHSSQMI